MVFDTLGEKPFANETNEAASLQVFGLEAYRDAWRALIDIGEPELARPRKELQA